MERVGPAARGRPEEPVQRAQKPPSARRDLGRWQRSMEEGPAATAALPACPALTTPSSPACRAARHWGKGRGAEGAALARRGRSAPVPFFTRRRRRRHGGAAAAHQPCEELLRWRLRGRVPRVRGAPARHHQGQAADPAEAAAGSASPLFWDL